MAEKRMLGRLCRVVAMSESTYNSLHTLKDDVMSSSRVPPLGMGCGGASADTETEIILIMIIIDHLCMALFSGLHKTHCA